MADPGGTRTYTYNNANRLSAVLDGGITTASYVHNALGQRTKKTTGGTDVIYLYDLDGNLLAEHDATGALIRDYVWMAGRPVAQIDQGEAFSYLHVDHLGAPRLATDDSQVVVWRWDGDAFGTTLPDEDPDGNGSGVTVNLRFPGQYFDAETGFHYNYFRTYDPSTGRYVESDPIGLRGGRNTFTYASANPNSFVDPLGLERIGQIIDRENMDALAGKRTVDEINADRNARGIVGACGVASAYGAYALYLFGPGAIAKRSRADCN